MLHRAVPFMQLFNGVLREVTDIDFAMRQTLTMQGRQIAKQGLY